MISRSAKPPVIKTSLSLFAAVFILTHISAATASGRLPGNTITNSKGTTLQFNVCNSIYAIEQTLAPACKTPRIIQTEISGEPRRLGFGRMMQWTERWTLDRCGAKTVLYMIRFDFRGSVGTFKITPPPH